ncbi:MAG: PatB family C-S lyase [Verrucomicrobiota bacterium]
MKYDFDSCPDRGGTGSLKWDRYSGKDILPFWVADMDFRTAPEIETALASRLAHGVFGYTIPFDQPIASVVRYLQEQHGVRIDPEWLIWLPGLVPALNLIAQTFCSAEQGVITSTPVYPPFLTAPKNASVPLHKVPLVRNKDSWEMDFSSLEEKPSGGAFFLCNPHNPVGCCFDAEDLQRLVALCREKQWILCSDEIHCDLILDPTVKHLPALSITTSEVDQLIALYAPSKTWNLPGLACAFAVVPNGELRARFKRGIQGIITEINCFGYAGCTAAYENGESWRQELLKVLRKNRERVYHFFSDKSELITIYPMEATYLAWFDCRRLPVKDPARLFEKFGVGLSDGAPFGQRGWLRLNFGCPPDQLAEGLERMQEAFDSL